jgi:hypothetical protein
MSFSLAQRETFPTRPGVMMRHRLPLHLSIPVPALIMLFAIGCASAPVPLQSPVGLSGLPAEITVAE